MLLRERMKLIGWFLSHDLLCACGILKSLDVFISMRRGRAWKKNERVVPRPRRFHYERAYRASTFEITNLSAQKTRYLTFNNDKPWFSTKLKQLRLAKEDAYRSGDKALYKQAKYTLNREIRVAKKNYAGKLKKQLSSNDPTSVWKGLKAITSYKTPPPSTEANQQLTEDLNSFLL